jgi:hypothetical protein
MYPTSDFGWWMDWLDALSVSILVAQAPGSKETTILINQYAP